MYPVVITWAVNAVKDDLYISPLGSWSVDAFASPPLLPHLAAIGGYRVATWSFLKCTTYRRTISVTCLHSHCLTRPDTHLQRFENHITRSTRIIRARKAITRLIQARSGPPLKVMRPRALSQQKRIRELHQSSDAPLCSRKGNTYPPSWNVARACPIMVKVTGCRKPYVKLTALYGQLTRNASARLRVRPRDVYPWKPSHITSHPVTFAW